MSSDILDKSRRKHRLENKTQVPLRYFRPNAHLGSDASVQWPCGVFERVAVHGNSQRVLVKPRGSQP